MPSVNAGEWWPSQSYTCFEFAPSLNSIVAAVCRKVWKPGQPPKPALRAALQDARHQVRLVDHAPGPEGEHKIAVLARRSLRSSHSAWARLGESGISRRPYFDFGAAKPAR